MILARTGFGSVCQEKLGCSLENLSQTILIAFILILRNMKKNKEAHKLNLTLHCNARVTS